MKIINFSLKDKNGEVLATTHLIVRKGDNWLDIEDSLAEMLEDMTGKNEKTSAAILCGQWFSLKGFPDGMHFFINYPNDWGFTSAYLFREV